MQYIFKFRFYSRFLNKDLTNKPELVQDTSAGIYIINPELMDTIPKDSYFDVPDLIKKSIQNGKNVLSYLIKEYWLAIDNPHQLDKAIEDKKVWE